MLGGDGDEATGSAAQASVSIQPWLLAASVRPAMPPGPLEAVESGYCAAGINSGL